MYEIDRKLKELSQAGTPVRIALIGAGQMGKDIVSQISKMEGIICDIVVDVDSSIALEAYHLSGNYDNIVTTDSLEEAEAAINSGKKIASSSYIIATRLSSVQCVIDATGSPEMGARITMECIFYKKHIVMMNVECDITIGPILRKLCEQAGIVYSLTAGDEPGSIIEIYRFAKALGFEVIAAGKGKNNPLDIYANPSMPEWKERKLKNVK